MWSVGSWSRSGRAGKEIEEDEHIPGKREEEHFDTEEKKLGFMQKFGWLIDDEDVKKYSAKFKGKV